MIRTISLLVLAACNSEPSPPAQVHTPPTPAQSTDRAALLAGKVPFGVESTLINARCLLCHSVDYLTQQRLSEAAWKKTIDKMRKFGASLTDTEAASLVAFAARYWNPDLPERTWVPVPAPSGALPMNP